VEAELARYTPSGDHSSLLRAPPVSESADRLRSLLQASR
jgi:hypothetical protein